MALEPPKSVEDNARLMKEYGIEEGVAKECFSNAGQCVLTRTGDELYYTEGYAAGIFPVHHAWLTTKDGQVIDPTWRGQEAMGVTVEPGRAYYGIPMKTKYVRRTALKTEHWGVFSHTNPKVYEEGLPKDAIADVEGMTLNHTPGGKEHDQKKHGHGKGSDEEASTDTDEQDVEDTNKVSKDGPPSTSGNAIRDMKVFHGGKAGEGKLVTYYTTDEQTAKSYAVMFNDRFGEGGEVHTSKMTIENPAPQTLIDQLAKSHGIDNEWYTPASVFDTNLHDEAAVKELIGDLKSRGHDGTVLADIPYGLQKEIKAYITFTGGATKATSKKAPKQSSARSGVVTTKQGGIVGSKSFPPWVKAAIKYKPEDKKLKRWLDRKGYTLNHKGPGPHPSGSSQDVHGKKGSKDKVEGKRNKKNPLKKKSVDFPPANPEAWDTESQYRIHEGAFLWDPKKDFTPERAELHEAILADIFKDAEPSDNPTFTLLGGGAASGKSTIIREGMVDDSNTVTINPDDIKGYLPEYKELLALKDPGAAGLTHEESSYLSKVAMRRAADGDYNFMLDGTGNSTKQKLERKVRVAQDKGYKVIAEYVTVDTATAVERNRARASKTGRMVPETALRHAHAAVSKLFPDMVLMTDEARLWDTNSGTKQIAQYKRDKGLKIMDKEAYQRFLDKAND